MYAKRSNAEKDPDVCIFLLTNILMLSNVDELLRIVFANLTLENAKVQ